MPKTSYEIAKVRHLFSYVYTFIVISLLPKWYPAEWIVGLLYKRLREEFFGKLPNDNIVEANLTAHIRRIVD
jgi:hypothetical protein